MCMCDQVHVAVTIWACIREVPDCFLAGMSDVMAEVSHAFSQGLELDLAYYHGKMQRLPLSKSLLIFPIIFA